MVNEAGSILLLTGLSGAGKTSIGRVMQQRLQAQGRRVELLDGDDLRQNLCRDLGYSKEDRIQNFERMAFVAAMLSSHGITVLIAAIAPFREQRDSFRAALPQMREIYIQAPLQACEARDPKGLYAAARRGDLKAFTGIDSPYEVPLKPHLVCRTDIETLEESANKVWAFLAAL